MKKTLAILSLLLLLFACKNKQNNQGIRPEGSDDFFVAYSKLKLPFTITDSTMNAADSANMSYEMFTKFIPDTVFNTPFGKTRKLTIHPLGKIEQKDKETYFISLVKSADHAAVYLSVIDKDKFTVSMPLVISKDENDKKNHITHSASIDKRLTIVVNKDWNIGNDTYYYRTIYAYNNVGIFTTVLTETNQKISVTKGILNPFDTFPKRYKYSGDYSKGNSNVLFIRDGKAANEYRFFVHFSNDGVEGESCGGELKGVFKMTSDKTGVFTSNADPCGLDITFADNKVQLKEKGSCGNYRGIKCFFNDIYSKKK